MKPQRLVRRRIVRSLSAIAAASMLFALPARATEQASYVTPAAGPMSMATFVGTYLNPGLRALASCSWGTSSPVNGPGAAPLPYQCWVDTTADPAVVKYFVGSTWVIAAKAAIAVPSWTPSYRGTDLGTASTATTGTSGHTLGFLDIANTWSATQSGATAAVDTTTTQFATTAFVIGQAASATPLINGTAAVGTSTRFARGDHVHPTDTTRAPLASPTFTGTPAAPTASPGTNTTQLATTAYADAIAALKANLASPTFTGTPAAPTAAAATNTTQLATTAFVLGQASSSTPTMDGTAAAGSSFGYSRADHVHPTDTSRAPLASPTFTGTPSAPTATGGTNTTQLATTQFVQSAVVAATTGVASIAGNTGAFTLGNGLTNATNDLRVNLSTASNVLSGNVALNNTGTYFDGPSMAQGTSGTWLASGAVSVTDTGAIANIKCKLWDGTTVIASGLALVGSASSYAHIALSGVLTSPAANIRISCIDTNDTNGRIDFNASGNSKDSFIVGVRLQ